MAVEHSTENESENSPSDSINLLQNTQIPIKDRIYNSDLYYPAVIEIKFRRDSKCSRITCRRLCGPPQKILN